MKKVARDQANFGSIVSFNVSKLSAAKQFGNEIEPEAFISSQQKFDEKSNDGAMDVTYELTTAEEVVDEFDPNESLMLKQKRLLTNESNNRVIDSIQKLTYENSGIADGQDVTNYFVVDKILGSRSNDLTGKREFLMKLNPISASISWNLPPSGMRSFDPCYTNCVLYVEKSEDLIASQMPQKQIAMLDIAAAYTAKPNGEENAADKSECSFDNEIVVEKAVPKPISGSNDHYEPKLSNLSNDVISDGSAYKCEKCGLLLRSKLLQRKHRRECSPTVVRLLSCSKCPRKFCHRGNLKRHEAIHRLNTVYLCSFCGCVYGCLERLKLHEKRVHFVHHRRKRLNLAALKRQASSKLIENRERTRSGIRERSQKFACPQCDQQFHSKILLEEHEVSHENRTRRRAAISRPSTRQQSLEDDSAVRQQSLEDDSAVRQQFLEDDSTAASIPSSLRSSPPPFVSLPYCAPPYSCSHCCRSFKTKAAELVHSSVVHPDDPDRNTSVMECLVCGLILKSRNNLLFHMCRHTNEKPYECRHCEYKAIQPISVSKHMQFQHGCWPQKKCV